MRRGLWTAFAFALAGVGCAHSRAMEPGPREEGKTASLGEGLASFYGPGLEGRLTANGERFDPRKLTAAHRTLPFGTCVRVVNLGNGREIDVRVNDRGPYAGHRIIDVSKAAAVRLGMIETGLARVRLFRCGELR